MAERVAHQLRAARGRPDGGAPAALGPARLSRLQALRAFDASPRGLPEQEAEERLARHGENTVLPEPEPGRLGRIPSALGDPFTGLLAGLTAVCALIGSWGSTAILGTLVVTACALRLTDEHRAATALAALRALVPTTATVLRRAGGTEPLARELPVEQLVPGDVVHLAAGDAVPADLRLLRAEGLTLDQSALTGESEPVHRAAVDLPPAAASSPFEEPHLCFAGSTVVTGSATALVLATGADTRFGVAHRPGPVRHPGRSAVERGVRRAVRAMVLFMAAAVPATVAADTLLHGWSAALLPFAVAAAVGLTPELLPLVISAVLARGSAGLRRDGLVVRRLPTIGELGALDVLCLDKTGTLSNGETAVLGGLDPAGEPDQEPLRWAALAAEAALLAGDPGLAAPLDEALLVTADQAGLLDGPDSTVRQLLPFDPVRRYAGAVLGLREDGHRQLLVVKGAPEAVLERCPELPEGQRAAALALVDRQAAAGVRLLAVALAEQPRLGTAVDFDGLRLLGFVALSDEPVAGAAAALAELSGSGVALTVLTGDHPSTALRLCEQLGLAVDRVVLGAELAGLSEAELAAAAARGALFARCDPEQKAAVVRALRRAGHTVGFLGDGVNDVPALRTADVGFVTPGAVGAARAWADVLLGGSDPARLGRALAVGREAVARVAAYLRIALSCNLGNAVSMLAGGVLLPFLPMLPAQVLLQNLCFDAAQLSFAVSGRHLAGGAGPGGRPVRLRWGALAAFALGFGLLNSVGDVALFAVMRRITHGFTGPGAEGMFHTAWFTENLLTQALALPVLHGLTGARPRPPRPVWCAAAALAVLGVLLPSLPGSGHLGFVPLPFGAAGPLALVVLGYGGLLLAARRLWRLLARWDGLRRQAA
ncbi:HAD-IC family P-type ATPase [Kitasatospora sp. RB6PN24]|uniref:HAD-IC family P-type ATPase n=1 Tax=Kitasatospora humi TaxID=2893891 RepID=UPI001E3DD81B|nr:HAD-IC family P-type ATPase [Kitasatospora humi]MCC9310009.1 HAD-IC family P-type ATPase [Kitasatospora humi]